MSVRQSTRQRWRDGGLPFLGAFADLLVDPEANDTAAGFVRDQIRTHRPRPRRTAERLCPDQVIGCKRMCVDTGYYETFNLPHVHLVDLRESPIKAITAQRYPDEGAHYELDAIVYATGFDAMTGALMRIDIRGRDGVALRDAWSAGPRTYLGLGVAGFPNLFTITGPGSPSVLTNMVVSIEQHVDGSPTALRTCATTGTGTIEPTNDAQTAWVEFVNHGCRSHAVSNLQLVVSGRKCSGKDACLHALHGFSARTRRSVRRSPDRLRRIRARVVTVLRSTGLR